MIIFRDIVSEDELFTDSNRYKIVNDCIYEIECKHVIRREGEIVLPGANPSAEEAEEGTDAFEERGLDVVLNGRMFETGFKKSDFKTYLKSYGKRLIEKIQEDGKPEDVDKAKKRLQDGVKFILERFDNLQFFLGESADAEGGVMFAEYIDEKPVMYAFVAGIMEEKA